MPFGKKFVAIFHNLHTHNFFDKFRKHSQDTLKKRDKVYYQRHTWWALQIKSKSCRLRNLLTTSAPNVKETPRSFSPHPCTSLSGSDHRRSHSRPVKYSRCFDFIASCSWLLNLKKCQKNRRNAQNFPITTLPVSGTSVGRMIRRICSIPCKSGLKPPWQQKIFSSIIAAIGRQLKQSVNVFHNLILYLRLPVETQCLFQRS